MKNLWVILLGAGCIACTAEDGMTPVFHADENPQELSVWGQVAVENDQLVLADSAVAYGLNTPLFSDYAHKLRTVWMAEGTSATYRENEVMDFPVGTVITKTFYYEIPDGSFDGNVLKSAALEGLPEHALSLDHVRLVETRLLVRRDEGWAALPYVWNEEQTEATLQRAGDIKRFSLVNTGGSSQDFSYVVPDVNQCAGCHATNATTREVQPIGPKARHLNREFAYRTGSTNQLSHWQETGFLVDVPAPENAPRNAVWSDQDETIDARARAYLDANCSHCHNKVGPADTSGLHLEPEDPVGPNLGICKPPIAAGTGTGGRYFDIVPGDPEASIFTYRLASTNPAEMMPELGRSLAHEEGVELIRQWIAELDGTCASAL